MIDATGLSVFAFAALKLAMWVALAVLGYGLGKRIVTHAAGVEGSTVARYESAIRANVTKTLATLIYAFVVLHFTFAEGPYRPKSTIAPPPDSTSGERAVPEFQSEPRKPTWDETQRRNAEENEKSREEFQRLPAAGQ